MDKIGLRKNRLDLEYNGETQKANAFLILLTTGVLSFIGTFIWLKENKLYGIIITALIIVIGSLFYWRSYRRMKEILYEVENVK